MTSELKDQDAMIERLAKGLREVIRQLDINAEANRMNCWDDPDWTGIGEAWEAAESALIDVGML